MSTTEKRPARFVDPLDRARQISQALSEAARLARFSTRARTSYSGGGFQARRGAALMRAVILGTFVLFVVIPSVGAYIYFGLIASDQFVSESKFSVIGNFIPQQDGVAAITGLNAVAVVQDTQIVANYLGTRAAVEALSKQIDLKKIYSDPKIDYISRFNSKNPIEKFLRYWQNMATETITMPSGIVILRVKAFSRQDAVDIANAVISVSEALVNDMNNRENKDARDIAELELQRATARLTHARLELEKARNDQGMLDASKAGDAINVLVTETKSALLQMQQEYATKSKLVSPSSPQMRVLKDRIDATVAQIADMQSKLTSAAAPTTANPTISASISRFSELQLEEQIAERLYAGAIASVEVARIASERKQIYLNPFVEPSLPQEAEYPKRLLSPTIFSACVLAIWGACVGLLTLIRNHMA